METQTLVDKHRYTHAGIQTRMDIHTPGNTCTQTHSQACTHTCPTIASCPCPSSGAHLTVAGRAGPSSGAGFPSAHALRALPEAFLLSRVLISAALSQTIPPARALPFPSQHFLPDGQASEQNSQVPEAPEHSQLPLLPWGVQLLHRVPPPYAIMHVPGWLISGTQGGLWPLFGLQSKAQGASVQLWCTPTGSTTLQDGP